MEARIFKPTKNAMQSGTANSQQWVLEYLPTDPRNPEPLMGWVSSADTNTQLRLKFDTIDQAIAYAQKNGLQYHVFQPEQKRLRIKSYADNFTKPKKPA